MSPAWYQDPRSQLPGGATDGGTSHSRSSGDGRLQGNGPLKASAGSGGLPSPASRAFPFKSDFCLSALPPPGPGVDQGATLRGPKSPSRLISGNIPSARSEHFLSRPEEMRGAELSPELWVLHLLHLRSVLMSGPPLPGAAGL